MFSFAIIAVILSCSSGDKKSISGSSDVSYNVIRPIRQDTVFVSKFVADIQAVRHIELRSRVNGYIESVFVDEGSRVKKDQILFKINDLEYKEELLKARSQLKSAEAQLATKQLEYDNAIKLYKEELISGAEVSIARANLDL
jgi:membrane fusion protein (multidrug efflux system)